jgi:hypothetical protein
MTLTQTVHGNPSENIPCASLKCRRCGKASPRNSTGEPSGSCRISEGVVRQGHEVTFFASGDSRTSARLRTVCEKALRLDPSVLVHAAPLTVLMEHVVKRSGCASR